MRKELDISAIKQETTEWCWAACAQMIIGFTNNNQLTQEQIVATMYGVPVKSVSVKNPDCNRPASVSEIMDVFDEYSVSYEYSTGVLSYEDLINELNTRPVEIGIKWADGAMHAILVFGYNTNYKTLQEVLIRDPADDKAPTVTYDYADLINGHYGQRSRGKWIDTFWKLQKVAPV